MRVDPHCAFGLGLLIIGTLVGLVRIGVPHESPPTDDTITNVIEACFFAQFLSLVELGVRLFVRRSLQGLQFEVLNPLAGFLAFAPFVVIQQSGFIVGHNISLSVERLLHRDVRHVCTPCRVGTPITPLGSHAIVACGAAALHNTAAHRKWNETSLGFAGL